MQRELNILKRFKGLIGVYAEFSIAFAGYFVGFENLIFVHSLFVLRFKCFSIAGLD